MQNYHFRKIASIIFWLAAIAVIVSAYFCAQGMAWQFDDYPNLNGLGNVNNSEGGLDFLFGGNAGPAGRPLSLLSFVPNYADWPNNPWGFAAGNLFLHGLNALLAALLFFRLWSSADFPVKNETFSSSARGCASALIWASLAIHTTGILMPVQRMTLVSAFFVLLTLWLFVDLRQRFAGSQSLGPVALISLVVGVGSILAIFGKENGALTIGLVAVIESFFFSRLASVGPRKIWRLWVILAWFVLPVFLIGKYLIFGWSGLMESYEYFRPFGFSERLATQSVILWEYLRQILLPRAALFGPFHDGHIVYDWSMWQPWVASLAWPLVFLALVKLTIRGWEVARVFLFALVFYLVAHQIESTFLPLELYFEHRNYIATIGFSFALTAVFLCFARSKIIKNGFVSVLAMSTAFIALQVFSIYQVASLFGQPILGAEMWHRYHPNSQRAAQTLAWQYGLNGFDAAALKVLDDFTKRQPDQIGVRHQALFLSCTKKIENENLLAERFKEIGRQAEKISYTSYLTTGLRELGDAIRAEECPGLSVLMYYNYLQTILNSVPVSKSGITRNHFDFELSLTAQKMGMIDESIYYAKQAFYDAPAMNSGQRVAVLLFQKKEFGDAIAWIDEVLDHAPDGVRRWAWQKQFASMREAIVNVQSMIENGV